MARFYAATGDGIARLDEADGALAVEPFLAERCAVPSRRSGRPGYRLCRSAQGGVRRSVGGGRNWADCGLPEPGVFSLAVSAADGAVYAGTEPSQLFRTDDQGESWTEPEALLELPSRSN
jgi:hypothetical protein